MYFALLLLLICITLSKVAADVPLGQVPKPGVLAGAREAFAKEFWASAGRNNLRIQKMIQFPRRIGKGTATLATDIWKNPKSSGEAVKKAAMKSKNAVGKKGAITIAAVGGVAALGTYFRKKYKEAGWGRRRMLRTKLH